MLELSASQLNYVIFVTKGSPGGKQSNKKLLTAYKSRGNLNAKTKKSNQK